MAGGQCYRSAHARDQQCGAVMERMSLIPKISGDLQAVFAMKRLGPCACLPLHVLLTAEPTPCPVFAVLDYL